MGTAQSDVSRIKKKTRGWGRGIPVYQYINNLETKRSYKKKVNLKNFRFVKKSIERFKNYSLIC